MLPSFDADFVASLFLLCPQAPLPEDTDARCGHPLHGCITAAVPRSMHDGLCIPDALQCVDGAINTAGPDAVDAVLPKPHPVPPTQTRAIMVLSRRLGGRLADAAVLTLVRMIPFMSDLQAQVLYHGATVTHTLVAASNETVGRTTVHDVRLCVWSRCVSAGGRACAGVTVEARWRACTRPRPWG